MSPLTQPITELHLAVQKAEARAAALGTTPGRRIGTASDDELHDHRVAVAGDLADTLDRIQPGLGMRWMAAMHPEVDYWPELSDEVPA